jgi:transposase
MLAQYRELCMAQGILLLHNNARPHSAAATVEAIRQLKFYLLLQPLYNPELAPSDYHMFGPRK